MTLLNKIILISFILFLHFIKPISGAVITGIISDENGNPLPFASVFVKNSTTGVSANNEGKYFIELPSGTYTLIYSYVGYLNIEKQFNLSAKQYVIFDAQLMQDFSVINEIEIIADKVDRAKSIMFKVKQNRKKYLNAVQNFTCEMYLKTSIEKEYKSEDSLKSIVDEAKNINDFLKRDKLNLIEYMADIYYKSPNSFKEEITAYHDFSEEKPPGSSITVSAGIDDGDIASQQYTSKNPYLFETDNISNAFNFYENLINIPKLCNQPLKSPLSDNSFLNYKYEFIEVFFEDSSEIYKIKVTPVIKSDALFYGHIYIEAGSWALVAADLSINEQALLMHKNFRIIENYKKIDTDIYLPVNLNIVYTIKTGKVKILGETKIKSQNYKVNINIENEKFNNEIRIFKSDAFNKDTVFWTENRPAVLKSDELKFISKTDSLKEYYKSEVFLKKQDSIFNRIDWWKPFVGIGHKNHYKGIEYMFGGLLQQVIPFGIGGYRHKLPFYLNKELNNGMLLETSEEIDYGFNNQDLKGKIGIGLTYYPKKFVRTFMDIGNTYDLINNYASVEQIFSRSNYVNTKFLQIKQRMEMFNGLYAELSLLYSNQNPITDIQLEKWSEYLFGELNDPTDFKKYIKCEIKLKLKYKINQKYYIKGNKKIIVGENNPEIFFEYRKGIPELFNSEVNFDYFEIGANADHQLARLGNSRWQVSAGWFANTHRLRLLEYKYFRGSDHYFFSDPLRSFQLLGSTLNSNNSFWQANYVHHFNGIFLNKIPLINFLKLGEAAGAGSLNIPNEHFYHFEMFAGLEKIFRIKKQLFRFGIYAVTADNNLSNPQITWKIGFSFFNSYTNKWTY